MSHTVGRHPTRQMLDLKAINLLDWQSLGYYGSNVAELQKQLSPD
jgi:hypothetical protein